MFVTTPALEERVPRGLGQPGSRYWAAMTGRYYCCQGNTLTGREVVTAMAAAYEETQGSLTDRLMAEGYDVESATEGMEEQVRTRFPEVFRLFVRAQSRQAAHVERQVLAEAQ